MHCTRSWREYTSIIGLCEQLCCCCHYKFLSCWALYKVVLEYRFAPPKCAIGQRGTVLSTTGAVQRYFQPPTANFFFQTIPADRCIAPAVVHCIKVHLYSAFKRSHVAVQHSTSRRTLCQGSLLHPHSSLHPGPQLTGTSASGISDLENRLGQSWQEGLQCSGNITGWCIKDMLHDSGTSGWEELKEINLLRSTLGEINRDYTWIQMKKLLQEQASLWEILYLVLKRRGSRSSPK